MKKMILLLLLVAASFYVAKASEESITPHVLNAFKTEFTHSDEVNWEKSTQFFKADFTMYGQPLSAYYSLEGDFLALIRKISITQLPIQLLRELEKKRDRGYRISDLFEMSTQDHTSYYLKLNDPSTEVVFSASNGTHWKKYKKTKKRNAKSIF